MSADFWKSQELFITSNRPQNTIIIMQCFQKMYILKFHQLQCLPLIIQPSYNMFTSCKLLTICKLLTSCQLFTRVTSYRRISRWPIAYHQAICNRNRSVVPLAVKPLLVRYCSNEITKPVLLYRGEQKRLFQFVSFFAISQLIFWVYLTNFAFTSMKDSHMKQEIKYGPEGAPNELRNWTTWEGIKLNLSASRWRYGVTVLSMIAGGGIFTLAFLYSRKNINALVLRQGGKHLTFKTYGIFAQGYTFTVPVKHVSCEYTRHGGRKTLPIKVKDHRMFYTLDTGDGKFYNGRLFDTSVTVRRHF
ncbi:transmembrane protein 223-like [Anneissia japonica]|uniref:transmembrane protein 223-like n=1 Tax=Anneissia japonica TaxID=1529436 RepID=UPI00142565FD|nr:transmembrane protein 223-like [Anneissia japonica]